MGWMTAHWFINDFETQCWVCVYFVQTSTIVCLHSQVLMVSYVGPMYRSYSVATASWSNSAGDLEVLFTYSKRSYNTKKYLQGTLKAIVPAFATDLLQYKKPGCVDIVFGFCSCICHPNQFSTSPHIQVKYKFWCSKNNLYIWRLTHLATYLEASFPSSIVTLFRILLITTKKTNKKTKKTHK